MLARINKAMSELGPLVGVAYLVDRLMSRAERRVALKVFHIVSQPVPSEPLLPRRRGNSILAKRIDPLDPALGRLNLDAETLKHRKRSGVVCWGVFVGDELIGCQWFNLGRHDEESFRARFVLSPERTTAWDFDIYIVPEHRSGLAFARLWGAVFEDMRQLGVEKTVSFISAYNARSVASHRRLGGTRMGWLIVIFLGGVQIIVATVSPYIAVSTSATTSQPTLRIRAKSQSEGGEPRRTKKRRSHAAV